MLGAPLSGGFRLPSSGLCAPHHLPPGSAPPSMSRSFGESYRVGSTLGVHAITVFCSWDYKVTQEWASRLQHDNIRTQLKVSRAAAWWRWGGSALGALSRESPCPQVPGRKRSVGSSSRRAIAAQGQSCFLLELQMFSPLSKATGLAGGQVGSRGKFSAPPSWVSCYRICVGSSWLMDLHRPQGAPTGAWCPSHLGVPGPSPTRQGDALVAGLGREEACGGCGCRAQMAPGGSAWRPSPISAW